jgi:hypothetical protein
MFAIMAQPPSQIPIRITFIAGVLAGILVLFINIFGQSPNVDPISSSERFFSWGMAAIGFVTLTVAIVYGFFKKQKYDNLKTDRDEWKGIAESREERIVEIQEKYALVRANLELTIKERDSKIRNLEVSNEAVVSQNMQMKAILKKLRLDGKWEGHEDNLHTTEG